MSDFWKCKNCGHFRAAHNWPDENDIIRECVACYLDSECLGFERSEGVGIMIKPEPKTIFVLTTLGKLTERPGWLLQDGYGTFERTRLWGWFTTLKQAQEAVYEDSNGVLWTESGYYDYIVIEEIREGVSFKHKEYWFFYDRDQNKWVECSKPNSVAEMRCFSLG